jgi:hypothetical protein
MRVVVVYESMYGNTRTIAEAIGDGMKQADVVTVPVGNADEKLIAQADLIVVGGPTHTFGMSRPQSRLGAVDAARKPGSGLTLGPEADRAGLREWLSSLGTVGAKAAVFDTRIEMPAIIGHAAKGYRKLLRRRGVELVASPQSFFVTKHNTLQPGQIARARAWGDALVARMSEGSVEAGNSA